MLLAPTSPYRRACHLAGRGLDGWSRMARPYVLPPICPAMSHQSASLPQTFASSPACLAALFAFCVETAPVESVSVGLSETDLGTRTEQSPASFVSPNLTGLFTAAY